MTPKLRASIAGSGHRQGVWGLHVTKGAIAKHARWAVNGRLGLAHYFGSCCYCGCGTLDGLWAGWGIDGRHQALTLTPLNGQQRDCGCELWAAAHSTGVLHWVQQSGCWEGCLLRGCAVQGCRSLVMMHAGLPAPRSEGKEQPPKHSRCWVVGVAG